MCVYVSVGVSVCERVRVRMFAQEQTLVTLMLTVNSIMQTLCRLDSRFK